MIFLFDDKNEPADIFAEIPSEKAAVPASSVEPPRPSGTTPLAVGESGVIIERGPFGKKWVIILTVIVLLLGGGTTMYLLLGSKASPAPAPAPVTPPQPTPVAAVSAAKDCGTVNVGTDGTLQREPDCLVAAARTCEQASGNVVSTFGTFPPQVTSTYFYRIDGLKDGTCGVYFRLDDERVKLPESIPVDQAAAVNAVIAATKGKDASCRYATDKLVKLFQEGGNGMTIDTQGQIDALCQGAYFCAQGRLPAADGTCRASDQVLLSCPTDLPAGTTCEVTAQGAPRFTVHASAGGAADADADGDGLTDVQETSTYHTDSHNSDSDGDGLTDGQEVLTYHSDPNNADTDGDGFKDGEEVKSGYSPTGPGKLPPAPTP